MTVSRRIVTVPSAPRPFTRLRRGVREAGAALVLLPLGLAALAALAAGRRHTARHLVLRGTGPRGAGTGRGGVAGGALLTAVLGVPALPPGGVLVLVVARGAFYGLVDQGPYDDSWGGPGRAGAWLAHFAVSLPVGCVAAAGLCGLAALQRQAAAPLRGDRRPRWVLPAVAACVVAGALFVFAFVRQWA